MSTALQLMNRLLLKSREDTITGFPTNSDRFDVYLDILNEAVRATLRERTWAFQHRTDGTLVTQAKVTISGTVSVSTTSAAMIDTSGVVNFGGDALGGEYRSSINCSTVTGISDHTFDILGGDYTGGGTQATFVLDSIPVAGGGSNTATHFVYQYILPSTVHRITGVWHQEEDDILAFEDEVVNFRQLITKPHEEMSDSPRLAMPGYISKTLDNVSSPNDASLPGATEYGLRIWPAPESAYSLNYSYTYKQANFTAATDELVGVPASVEDEIVELAYARQLITVQDDVNRGIALERRVLDEIERKNRNAALAPMRPKRFKTLDEIGVRPSGLTRTHRTVPTLSGV